MKRVADENFEGLQRTVESGADLGIPDVGAQGGGMMRAAVSLARLLSELGRHTESRELLAPVYGWFTEGLDAPDLKDAKTLLQALDA